MCNLYRMTATVAEMRKLFGPFEGDGANSPSAMDWLTHERDQACTLAVPFPDTDMRRIDISD